MLLVSDHSPCAHRRCLTREIPCPPSEFSGPTGARWGPEYPRPSRDVHPAEHGAPTPKSTNTARLKADQSQAPTKPAWIARKHPRLLRFAARRPSASGLAVAPSHKDTGWGSHRNYSRTSRDMSPHHKGYMPISAKIQPHPRSSALPFPMNGKGLMARPPRVASSAQTSILINYVKGF